MTYQGKFYLRGGLPRYIVFPKAMPSVNYIIKVQAVATKKTDGVRNRDFVVTSVNKKAPKKFRIESLENCNIYWEVYN